MLNVEVGWQVDRGDKVGEIGWVFLVAFMPCCLVAFAFSCIRLRLVACS